MIPATTGLKTPRQLFGARLLVKISGFCRDGAVVPCIFVDVISVHGGVLTHREVVQTSTSGLRIAWMRWSLDRSARRRGRSAREVLAKRRRPCRGGPILGDKCLCYMWVFPTPPGQEDDRFGPASSQAQRAAIAQHHRARKA